MEMNLIDAGLAKPIKEPYFTNREGQSVSEEEAFGCRVTLDITHPEMVLVADEVGGNTSMKGDGHVHGKEYIL